MQQRNFDSFVHSTFLYCQVYGSSGMLYAVLIRCSLIVSDWPILSYITTGQIILTKCINSGEFTSCVTFRAAPVPFEVKRTFGLIVYTFIH